MATTPYKNSSGGRVPGVTTVIGGNLGWNKEQLMFWANKVGIEKGINHRDVSLKAADAGTLCHALIELHIMKSKQRLEQVGKEIAQLKPNLDDSQIQLANQGFENFLKWESMTSLEVIETEPHLVSETYGYGGTPDCIGKIGGNGLAIIDFKTSSGVYPDMKIQIAAYKVLYEENRKEKITGGFHLLRIGKEDASFAHYHWENLDNAWEAFTHLLALHNLKKLLK